MEGHNEPGMVAALAAELHENASQIVREYWQKRGNALPELSSEMEEVVVRALLEGVFAELACYRPPHEAVFARLLAQLELPDPPRETTLYGVMEKITPRTEYGAYKLFAAGGFDISNQIVRGLFSAVAEPDIEVVRGKDTPTVHDLIKQIIGATLWEGRTFTNTLNRIGRTADDIVYTVDGGELSTIPSQSLKRKASEHTLQSPQPFSGNRHR